ncbi:MAG: septum site-determining protein MinC [Lachnospiraceae bacterium]|nr:septum site-determining protein MinC [Lachnospiraceae bacterium]
MRSTVVIKGNKSGMSIYLDPEAPFEQILKDIEKKFRESAKFWGSVQMALALEGRTLNANEEYAIVNAIMDSSQVEILCLIDQDGEQIRRCEKALNEKLMELSSQTGQFYKGDLQRGDSLESEASIVIIGDVHHGARVTAKGNIIILGELKGSVFAGAAGDASAVVVALDMAPIQIRIGDYSSRVGEKSKRLGRGPMIASVIDDSICTKVLKKSFLNMFAFN